MKGLKNWQTSILGFLALLCQAAAAQFPEWAPILTPLGGALLAAGLVAAKDGATGSAPS